MAGRGLRCRHRGRMKGHALSFCGGGVVTSRLPMPPEAKDLDAVVSNIIYHDAVWLGVDRGKMNRSVAKALRTGGVYVVCDSSARAGSGIADAQTLHRIDEQVVISEVTGAGLTLETRGDFLRNPDDSRGLEFVAFRGGREAGHQ